MKSINIISPYVIALVSSMMFLIAWLIPPAIYMAYLPEPDFIFLSFWTLSFYALCVAGFVVGVWIVGQVASDKYAEPYSLEASSPLIFIVFPLLLSTALCGVLLYISGSSVPSLSGLFTGQSGSGLKGTSSTTIWKHVLPVHCGVLWWAMRRARQLNLNSYVYKTTFVLALVTGLLTCIIRLDRTNLMPMIAGVAIISLHGQILYRKASFARIASLSLGVASSIITLFLGISLMRGAGQSRLLITGLMGYTIASYNRLAASIAGALHYSFAGHGLYLFPFLSYSTSLPIHTWVEAASPDIVQSTEFVNVQASGLVASFNWCGVFGYIYQDIGWWSALFLLFVGLLTGRAWVSFRQGRVFGTIFYPWFAFNVLYWFGWNLMFELHIVILIGVAIAMYFYEELFLNKIPSQLEVPVLIQDVLANRAAWVRS